MKIVGTKIAYGTAGGSAATDVGNLRAVDEFPDLNFDEYDDTEIDQASLIKDWEVTMIDAGKLGLTVRMTHAKYATLLALHTGIKRSWKITFSGLNTMSFDGRLKRLALIGGG